MIFHSGPNTPAIPTSGGSTTTTVDLNWNAVAGGSLSINYIVHWSVASPSTGVNSKFTQAETSTTIDGLQSNTRYTFKVSAWNGYVSSQRSAGKKIITSKFKNNINYINHRHSL